MANLPAGNSYSDNRYLFIDRLRFIAAFFMIQGHVFDALLAPQVKVAAWYTVHDFFHGFVAPVFLFASGLAFGVSTIRKWEEHIVWGTRVRQRMAKFIGLIGIGYALHLPYFSLRKIISTATAAEIDSSIQVDALQCIGFTLLLLQIGVLLIRNKKVFVRVVGICAAFVIFSAPVMWSIHFKGILPTWLCAYMNADGGSWFPLFPWSAYLLCGVVLGYWFVSGSDPIHAASVIRKSAVLSAAFVTLALVAMRLPLTIYPAHDFWKSDPAMFFVRLGAVGVVTSCIFLAERRLQFATRIPIMVGRESLFVYIVHLLIVYGSVLGPGMNQYIGPRLSLIQTTGIFTLVFAFLVGITAAWHALNARHRTVAVSVKYAAAAIFVFSFLTRRW